MNLTNVEREDEYMNMSNAIKGLCVTGALILPIASTSAQAADGCKFMLCMGAPNPMGVKECVSTIKDVLRDLRKGRAMPTCSLVDGTDSKASGSWIDHKKANPTPMCPDGYRQGSDNVIYHQGKKPASVGNRGLVAGGGMSVRFSNNSGTIVDRLYGDGYKVRSCIKGSLNGSIPSYSYRTSNKGDLETVTVPRQEWYNQTMMMTPDGADYEFTFYVDGQPFSKHRF